MADPGFPVGRHGPIRGDVDLRCGHFSAKMYAKMKEMGPIGGRALGTPPRSASRLHFTFKNFKVRRSEINKIIKIGLG